MLDKFDPILIDSILKELIKILNEENPFPEDIFIEPSDEDWKKYHAILNKENIPSNRFVGSSCRLGYNSCINVINEILKNE